MKKNLLIIIAMAMILIVSCGKDSTDGTQTQEQAENVKYDMLELSEDPSQSTQDNKVGYLAILLKDNAT